MEFIQNNIGNIVAGLIVFAALGFAVFRIVKNIRAGKGSCSCGCGGCSRC